MELLYIAPIAGLVALVFAAYLMASVLREDPGNQRMQEISQSIFEGAMAYLNRQYRTLAPFTLLVFAILLYFGGYKLALSFLVGAACSALAGYVGMTSTTKSNARTTEAARHSLNKALSVSFRAGSVMGMAVAGLGLLGVSVLYIVFRDPVVINSFAFGASAIAFFARIGGGIQQHVGGGHHTGAAAAAHGNGNRTGSTRTLGHLLYPRRPASDEPSHRLTSHQRASAAIFSSVAGPGPGFGTGARRRRTGSYPPPPNGAPANYDCIVYGVCGISAKDELSLSTRPRGGYTQFSRVAIRVARRGKSREVKPCR